jgi:hypothetical protein
MAYVASVALPVVFMLVGQTDYGLVFIIVIIMVAKRLERSLVHMASSAICGILRLSASSSA